jgi:hypothetical protein
MKTTHSPMFSEQDIITSFGDFVGSTLITDPSSSTPTKAWCFKYGVPSRKKKKKKRII